MKSNLEIKSKIPPNAKCVFKGVIFDVYQWEQEMFDGTYKTFEMTRLQPSVQIIALTEDKKIVLLNERQPNRENPYISFPGGGIDFGETPKDAASRELLEECGMKFDKLIFWREVGLISRIETSTHYFIAKGCKVVQKPCLGSGEIIEPFFVDFAEFYKISQQENFRNRVFSDLFFRMINNPKEIEKFKNMLFD